MKPRYLNPYTDFGFKKLFEEEANKELLVDFLNEVLPAPHKIAQITLKPTEKLARISHRFSHSFQYFKSVNPLMRKSRCLRHERRVAHRLGTHIHVSMGIDRVGGGLTPAVLSQNRAYGSVHGSSWILNPFINSKPMR